MKKGFKITVVLCVLFAFMSLAACSENVVTTPLNQTGEAYLYYSASKGVSSKATTSTGETYATVSVPYSGTTSQWFTDSCTEVNIDPASVYKVVFNNNVTTIGASTFAAATGLEKVVLPSSVTSVGEYAFYKGGSTDFSSYPDNQPKVVVLGGKTPTGMSKAVVSEENQVTSPRIVMSVATSYNDDGSVKTQETVVAYIDTDSVGASEISSALSKTGVLAKDVVAISFESISTIKSGAVADLKNLEKVVLSSDVTTTESGSLVTNGTEQPSVILANEKNPPSGIEEAVKDTSKIETAAVLVSFIGSDGAVYTAVVPVEGGTVAPADAEDGFFTDEVLNNTSYKVYDADGKAVEGEKIGDKDNIVGLAFQGVETIKSGSFENLKNLATVTIPSEVKVLEAGSFEGCGNTKTAVYVTDEEGNVVKDKYGNPVVDTYTDDTPLVAYTEKVIDKNGNVVSETPYYYVSDGKGGIEKDSDGNPVAMTEKELETAGKKAATAATLTEVSEGDAEPVVVGYTTEVTTDKDGNTVQKITPVYSSSDGKDTTDDILKADYHTNGEIVYETEVVTSETKTEVTPGTSSETYTADDLKKMANDPVVVKVEDGTTYYLTTEPVFETENGNGTKTQLYVQEDGNGKSELVDANGNQVYVDETTGKVLHADTNKELGKDDTAALVDANGKQVYVDEASGKILYADKSLTENGDAVALEDAKGHQVYVDEASGKILYADEKLDNSGTAVALEDSNGNQVFVDKATGSILYADADDKLEKNDGAVALVDSNGNQVYVDEESGSILYADTDKELESKDGAVALVDSNGNQVYMDEATGKILYADGSLTDNSTPVALEDANGNQVFVDEVSGTLLYADSKTELKDGDAAVALVDSNGNQVYVNKATGSILYADATDKLTNGAKVPLVELDSNGKKLPVYVDSSGNLTTEAEGNKAVYVTVDDNGASKTVDSDGNTVSAAEAITVKADSDNKLNLKDSNGNDNITTNVNAKAVSVKSDGNSQVLVDSDGNALDGNDKKVNAEAVSVKSDGTSQVLVDEKNVEIPNKDIKADAVTVEAGTDGKLHVNDTTTDENVKIDTEAVSVKVEGNSQVLVDESGAAIDSTKIDAEAVTVAVVKDEDGKDKQVLKDSTGTNYISKVLEDNNVTIDAEALTVKVDKDGNQVLSDSNGEDISKALDKDVTIDAEAVYVGEDTNGNKTFVDSNGKNLGEDATKNISTTNTEAYALTTDEKKAITTGDLTGNEEGKTLEVSSIKEEKDADGNVTSYTPIYKTEENSGLDLDDLVEKHTTADENNNALSSIQTTTHTEGEQETYASVDDLIEPVVAYVTVDENGKVTPVYVSKDGGTTTDEKEAFTGPAAKVATYRAEGSDPTHYIPVYEAPNNGKTEDYNDALKYNVGETKQTVDVKVTDSVKETESEKSNIDVSFESEPEGKVYEEIKDLFGDDVEINSNLVVRSVEITVNVDSSWD